MLQKWAQAYSSRAPKMKVKQMPRYTSMALMKQLALGREVRAPIISVVMVSTVVTPGGAAGKRGSEKDDTAHFFLTVVWLALL